MQTFKKGDFVAQLVEQYTFNVWVLGSSPSEITRLASKSTKASDLVKFGAFLFRYFSLKTGFGQKVCHCFFTKIHFFTKIFSDEKQYPVLPELSKEKY